MSRSVGLFAIVAGVMGAGSALAADAAPAAAPVSTSKCGTDRAACEKECETGNGEACFKAAGKQYEKGLHSSPQLAGEAAQRFYGKACQNGHQKSCARAASNLMWGKNPDRPRARTLLETACAANEPEACDRLGSYWDIGLFDGGKDPKRALSYFERGCSLDWSYDCGRVARVYFEGRGVSIDVKRGLSELEKSCAKGATMNCLELGKTLRTGAYGVKKDAKRAFSIYDDLCTTKKLSIACIVVGTMYRDGQGTTRDLAHAVVLYENACQARNQWGCTRLGELREKGVGGSKDLAAALELYERGCPSDKTFPGPGCYQAARLYERGAPGIARDEGKATKLFGRACFPSDLSPDGAGVNRAACAKAGPMLERAGDFAKARFAYQTSCLKFNDAAACSAAKRLAASKPAPPPAPAPAAALTTRS